VEVEAKNLGVAINELNRKFPGIERQLRNEQGEILSGFDFYINGISTYPADVAMYLNSGDEIIIVPVEVDVGG
jgi:molybdopterin converting factor small subunit